MKKIIFIYANLMFGLLCMLNVSAALAQNTQVTVTGIKSVKGQIVLNVFKDNKSYDDQKPYKKLLFEKKDIVDGTLVLNCTLESGIYGITLLDDENKSGDIDKNLLGIPKEGFGFSNFYMTKMSKPSFDDFKIEVKSNTENKIGIKVKYM
ncbi:Uncharacterized conserved protein, DUF2141 family [Chitinophaga sp. CF118]|uniref:DUF2141 domain-containing protein n=1 Tax=Chitinophaga sp. CF118 TaxID=1884367 RepID=UPI0008E8506D|nr:DUF2141 domain-containing protein [Chitinophaga sp. CF118]SFF02191.1 Uncharacterized conserved protein, DUF2141 family [Chitinophaga sp. CF118]